MNELAYIAHDSHFHARRWLRDRKTDSEVILITPPSGLNEAIALKGDFTSVSEIIQIPECDKANPSTKDGDRVTELGIQEIVLHLSVEDRPYSCSKKNNFPDIAAYYPLLRQLYELGLRVFTFSNAHGNFSVNIPHFLDEYKDRHKGKRCFVVGNGPSLNDIDMTQLKDEITFGSNRCYMGYERWGYAFTYWGISDSLQMEEYGDEYEDNIPSDTQKFCPFAYLPILDMQNTCPVLFNETMSKRFFSTEDPIYPGHSVTYMLLQLAAVMGCDPIILVGVDHNYSLQESWMSRYGRQLRENLVRPLRGTFFYHVIRSWRELKKCDKPLMDLSEMKYWDTDKAGKATHFDSGYTKGPKKKFQMPQPAEARKDYVCAKKWAEDSGTRILNAAPNSELDVFTKVKFEELFYRIT